MEPQPATQESPFFHHTKPGSGKTRPPPAFVIPLSNLEHLREGDKARFEARLTPTDDPKLKVEWYWNGAPMKSGSRFKTFAEFGLITLEIYSVYPEDSGQYTCRAYNDHGEAITSATMLVAGRQAIIFDSQVPRDTIEKIAQLEGYGQVPDSPVEEPTGKPPGFLSKPNDLALGEGAMARFECRVTPTDDPALKVEWLHNGQVLCAGSRINTVSDFGYVVLEINDLFDRDSGVYTCRATNKYGEATTSCNLVVTGREGIIEAPQVSADASKTILRLEQYLHRKDEVAPEEERPLPPRFIKEMQDNLNVPEGGKVHFDCRLEPKSDPTIRIDWFFNGQPFATGSRVRTTYDFGYISLDIDSVYPRDTGEYLCRATSKWGTAMTQARVVCYANQNIVTATQLPDLMAAEKIRQLDVKRPKKETQEEEIPKEPPRFVGDIVSAVVDEGESVRFETGVEPRGDPRLKVEWYRNGQPLPTGSRYHPVFELGFVSLDIEDVYPEDQGEYCCRAFNDHGEAFTKALITCQSIR